MNPHITIAVDARPLAFPGTGNATYLHRMLGQLLRLWPEASWLLVAHRGIHSTFGDLLLRENVEVEISHGARSRLGPLWLHGQVPQILGRKKADLFWATLAMMPFHYRQRCRIPSVVNFHDLNAYVAPKTMQGWNRMQHRLLNRAAIRESDRVLCLSETTRADILTYFPEVAAQKLEVVYPGSELPDYTPRPPANKIRNLENFFLCVGTLEPRKNQATLLEGYLRAQESRTLPPLLFVGRKGWGDESLYVRLKEGGLEKRNVWFLEDASESELRWCYDRCALLVLPSLHEGFGLPVLEAHQMGKPTLLSDIPIFREIGGQSRFVRTQDPQAWKQALLEAAEALRQDRLSIPDFDAGFWSWKTRAEHLRRILVEVLEQKTSTAEP